MFGQDADKACKGDDGQEGDDQDGNGPAQKGLDGTLRPGAVLPQGW